MTLPSFPEMFNSKKECPNCGYDYMEQNLNGSFICPDCGLELDDADEEEWPKSGDGWGMME
jgi:hypothetical protein